MIIPNQHYQGQLSFSIWFLKLAVIFKKDISNSVAKIKLSRLTKGDQGLPGEVGAPGERGAGDPGAKVRHNSHCFEYYKYLNLLDHEVTQIHESVPRVSQDQ